MTKHKVSGVPYEVDLINEYVDLLDQNIDRGDTIARLERENFLLRSRIEGLEREIERNKDDRK